MPFKKQVRATDSDLHLLFREHPQPMWVFDPQRGCIVEANAAAALLYGYSQDELRGMPISAIRFSDSSSHSSQNHRTKSGRIIEVDTAAHQFYLGEDSV